MDLTVSHDDLRAFAAACLLDAGVTGAAAELVADSLVQADLWGHPSHGIMRLFWCITRLQTGATGRMRWV